MTIKLLGNKSSKAKHTNLVPVNRKKGFLVEINGKKYRIFHPSVIEMFRDQWP